MAGIKAEHALRRWACGGRLIARARPRERAAGAQGIGPLRPHALVGFAHAVELAVLVRAATVGYRRMGASAQKKDGAEQMYQASSCNVAQG